MSYSLIKITAPTPEEARRIGRELVEARLAASVNLVPGLVSFYRWQGEVREAGEVLLLVKTRTALVDEVSAFVTARHGYRCPCVLAVPIAGGHGDYLDWIGEETSDEAGG